MVTASGTSPTTVGTRVSGRTACNTDKAPWSMQLKVSLTRAYIQGRGKTACNMVPAVCSFATGLPTMACGILIRCMEMAPSSLQKVAATQANLKMIKCMDTESSIIQKSFLS